MPSRTTFRALAAAGAAALALTATANAHAPLAKRFPTPGAKRAVVRTVQLTFREKVTAGTLTVTHRGVTVTPFTAGLVSGGKVLLASFPDGLPKGTLKVAWRVRAADGDRQSGSWSFRVTTGDASHGHG